MLVHVRPHVLLSFFMRCNFKHLGTDFGAVLSALSRVLPIDAETCMLLFIMADRWDEESVWAPYWMSLPGSFRTGLSFPPVVTALLEGTTAWREITRAQKHMQEAYDNTRPAIDALLQAYPTFLRPEWFTYESFVWAAELVYVVVIVARAVSRLQIVCASRFDLCCYVLHKG